MIEMSMAELEAEVAVVLPDREVMRHGKFVRNNVVVIGSIHQVALAANIKSTDSTAVAVNAVVILQNSGTIH